MPFEDGFKYYEYEVREVMNCVRTGKIDSEIMPLAETLSNMQTMDTLRDTWELRYPTE